MADAGTGGSECDLNFTFNASLSTTGGSGAWTKVSGAAGESFSSTTSPSATVTVSGYGTYTFRWTETNAGCSDSDDVTVIFSNQPVADAGLVSMEECDLSAQLSGIQSIPGSTASWSVVSGTASDLTFSNSNIFNPVVSSINYGSYTLRLTESNGTCNSTDDIVVTFTEQPVADAGTGGEVCGKDAGNEFALSASPSVGTGMWTQTSGPGVSAFSDASIANATVTVDTYGSYTFTWTETNGACQDSDNVMVTYYEAPVANADRGGAAIYDECDQNYLLDAVPSVAGSSGIWTKLSGSGVANFTNSTSPTTVVNVSQYGNYVFRWTETQGSCSSFDDVEINFYLQPVADAGAGGSECDLDFDLDAIPSSGTGQWSVVSGPGTPVFDDIMSASTVVSVDQYGTYTFRWTENNYGCSDYDDISVSFNQAPSVISVENDGGVLCEPSVIQLSGEIGGGANTGSWTLISGGTGTLSASSLTNNTVTATYIVTPAEYGNLVFRLTTDDADGAGPCTVDFMDVTLTVNESAKVNAGNDFEICEDGVATMNGSFSGASSSVSWSGGGGTFSNVNDPFTSYTPSQSDIDAGFVILTLTTDDPDGAGPCIAESDDVRITINALPEVALTGLNLVYAENDAPVEMEGFPSGGTYTGPGVNSGTNIFDPSNANIGGATPNIIVYEYTSPVTGCTNYDTVEVIVNAATTINFTVEGATIDTNTGNQQICAEQGLVRLFGSPSATTGLSPTSFSSTRPNLITQSGGRYFIQTNGFGLTGDTVRVKYTYTNSDNVTTIIFKDIIIFGSPVAKIAVDNSCIADIITFTDVSDVPSSTSVLSWIWDFGDGTVSNQPNPEHVYEDPGVKTAKLTITTWQGCTDQTSRDVRVGEVPVVNFDKAEICNGDATEFIDLSNAGMISDLVKHTWDFGDGEMISGPSSDVIPAGTHGGRTSGTFQNPFHEYQEVGNYDVTLTVETNDGCSNMVTKKVFILPFNVITISPETAYQESFEIDGGGWVPQANENSGTDFSWKWGEPNGSVIKSPGNKAWWTGINAQTYYPSEDSYINGPCFDIAALTRPMMAMDIWYDMEFGFDGAVLQYSVDGGISWQNIGTINEGINWYNKAGIISGPGDNPGNFNEGDQGWTGQSGGWISARYSLDEIPVAERHLVRLRIAFGSDANNPQEADFNGFAFDNVFVGNKTRTVLVEHFVDTEVDISNQASDHFKAIQDSQLAATGVSDFVTLEYHIANSGRDPFNADNPGDPSARSLYYGVSQAPNAVLGGNQFNGNPFDISLVDIDRRSLEDPVFEIDIQNIDSDETTLIADVTVTALTDLSEDVTVHLALVEEEIGYDGRVYYNVLKRLLFGGNGENLDIDWVANTSKTIRADWNITVEIYDPEKLSYIAFVQNKTTREVYATTMVAAPAKTSDEVTGIDKPHEKSSMIGIYPNPASDQVFIELSSTSLLNNFNWQIVDQRGVTMLKGSVLDSQKRKHAINTENLANGIYYVILESEGQTLTYQKLAIIDKQ